MNAESKKGAEWSLYLVRTAQGSLYTGVTTDVERRINEHEDADKKHKGAKALRGKGPLELAFKIVVGNRSDALKLEYRVKKLGTTDKQRLISLDADLEELRTWLQNK